MAILFWNERAGFYLREVTELQRPEVSAMERRIYGSRFTHQTRQHAEFLRTVYTVGMRRNEQLFRLVSEYKTGQGSASSRKNRTLWPDVPGLRARLERRLLQQETAWKKAANRSARIGRKRITARESFTGVWGVPMTQPWRECCSAVLQKIRYIWGNLQKGIRSNLLELLLGKHSKFCKDACNLRKKWRGFLD